MNHGERGTPFGMAVRFGQIALDDQAAAVLHHWIAEGPAFGLPNAQEVVEYYQHHACSG